MQSQSSTEDSLSLSQSTTLTATTRSHVDMGTESPYNDVQTIVIGTVLAAIIVVTVAGNFIVLITFAIDKSTRSKVSNLYILNLATADLCVGAISLPLNTVWLLKGNWPFGEAVCKFWLLIDYVTCLASVIGIILISLDRYLLMAFEMKYVLFQTPKRALLVILFSWALAFLFYAPAVLFWKYFAGESTIDHSENCEIEGLDNFVYGVVTMCVEFFIPLLVITYLNCRVYLYIRKMAKRKIGTDITIGGVQQVSNETEVSGDVSLAVNLGKESKSVSTADPGSVTAGPSGHTNHAKHRKAAKTLSILVAVFICCWTPYNITVLVTTLCDACWNEVAWEVTNNLLWCNSTLNPFLYALTNQQFRRNFVFILTFGRVKRKIVPAF